LQKKRKFIEYKTSSQYNRVVCIDEEIGQDILDFLSNKTVEKKFNYIVNRILEQRFVNYEEYEKLTQFNDISEMRIFPNGMNARIYCKEVNSISGTKYIIAAKLLEKKKSQNINKELNNFIKPIEDYEYEIE
jgi:hypothetical protein